MNIDRQIRIGILISWMAVLTGCAGASVEVPATFPTPLVDPLPVHVGILITEELAEYAFQEKLEDEGEWRIALGPVQKPMFEALAGGLFAQHSWITDVQNTAGSVDLALVPSIVDVQFSTPRQTRSDYFEVWIKYEFELFDSQGTALGKWPLTAYGKANNQNYGTSTTLQQAAVAACRDAIAFFTINFREVPAVKQWLAGRP